MTRRATSGRKASATKTTGTSASGGPKNGMNMSTAVLTVSRNR